MKTALAGLCGAVAAAVTAELPALIGLGGLLRVFAALLSWMIKDKGRSANLAMIISALHAPVARARPARRRGWQRM